MATWVYQKIAERDQTLNYWRLIPEEFIAVIETQNFFETFNHYRKQPIWQNLLQIDAVSAMSLYIEDLENVANKLRKTSQILKNRAITLSIHFNSQENVGVLLFISFNPEKENALLQEILLSFKQTNQFFFSQRRFKEIDIIEAKNLTSDQIFSYIIYKNYLIGTFSSILLDDVIRKISNEQSILNEFKPAYVQTYLQERVSIHLNTIKLAEWLQNISQHKKGNDFEILKNLGANLSFRLSPSYKRFIFQGSLPIPKQEDKFFFSIFKHQTPQPFGLKGLVPEATALLFHFSFSYADKFYQNLTTYWKTENATLEQNQQKFTEKYQFSWQNFYKSWDGEIALCYMESDRPLAWNKILFIKTKNIGLIHKQLQKLTQTIDQQEKISSLNETYNGYLIIQIRQEQFPTFLLGNFTQNFEECYFTLEKNYLVFFNNLQAARQTIDAWNQAKTWNEKTQSFLLTELEKKHNFSFVVNPQIFWNKLFENIVPEWQNAFKQIPIELVEGFGLQATQSGNTFTLQAELSLDKKIDRINDPFTANPTVTKTTLPQPAFTPAYLTQNPIENSTEILIQDFQNKLYLITQKGKFVWSRPVGSPMRSKVFQLDIYKNNRLQYAFIGTDRFNLIDRSGRNVPTFPLFNPDTTAQFHTLTILDLKNSKDYWFIISDTKGRVYFYDSNKYLQTGWKPKKLTHKLSVPVQHFRIQNKDYFILAQEDGLVQVFDLQGNEEFTFRLESKVFSSFAIEQGSTKASTYLVNTTEKGIFFKINLQGEFALREQLFMPSKKAQAMLCIDEKNKDWLITIISHNQTIILDKKGKTLFEKNVGTIAKTEVQYFNLGISKKIIAITDKSSNTSYLVDATQGKLLCEPFKSNKPVSILLLPNGQVQVFYVFNQVIQSFMLN